MRVRTRSLSRIVLSVIACCCGTPLPTRGRPGLSLSGLAQLDTRRLAPARITANLDPRLQRAGNPGWVLDAPEPPPDTDVVALGVSALAATGVRGMRWASHPEAMALGPGGEFLYFTVANAKSTRHGEPSPETTMLAGVMSRCITPRRCMCATAPASSTASPISSSTANGFAKRFKLLVGFVCATWRIELAIADHVTIRGF